MNNNKSVNKTINISVARKTRVPCLWERGGYDTSRNKGYAIVICDENGNKKTCITQREEVNNRHALIPIQEGDLCIEAIKDDYNRVFEGKTCINVWRIIKININANEIIPNGDCILELVNNLSFDIWIDEAQAKSIDSAIKAAARKVEVVNCDFLFYAERSPRMTKVPYNRKQS